MNFETVSFEEGEAELEWLALRDALEAGHRLPRAEIGDRLLTRGEDAMLSRFAWIDGMGMAAKIATVFPGNPSRGAPRIHGAVCVFCDSSGRLEAVIDFPLVTKWKTAADSLLAASRLARPDSRSILVVGAGKVARSLVDAYGAVFPEARFAVWNRTRAGAESMAAEIPGIEVADDLAEAVGAADIVSCATMSVEPLIRGEWLRPGQHLDLIGAFRPDMREVDDAALRRSRIFVDSLDTTVGHIGEIDIPLKAGVISPGDIVADHYAPEAFRRGAEDEITLFKNGGGAHLDLMTSRHILDVLGRAG